MTGGIATRVIRRWRPYFVAGLLMLAVATPGQAHHQSTVGGAAGGIGIPAIGHGEMPVIAEYRTQILDLEAKQPRTDLTLRRLSGFVEMQYFVCFWGLIPGSLSDEGSPFNECSHAYLAGVRALLAHMVAMPGDQSAANALAARIAAKIASDPIFATLCSNSDQKFDTGVVIKPDWQLAATHLPTVLTFAAMAILGAGFSIALKLGLSFGAAARLGSSHNSVSGGLRRERNA